MLPPPDLTSTCSLSKDLKLKIFDRLVVFDAQNQEFLLLANEKETMSNVGVNFKLKGKLKKLFA
jgi:hypothetical protein